MGCWLDQGCISKASINGHCGGMLVSDVTIPSNCGYTMQMLGCALCAVRCVLVQICTPDQLVSLILEGGLTNKLKGCTSPQAKMANPMGPDGTIWKLIDV